MGKNGSTPEIYEAERQRTPLATKVRHPPPPGTKVAKSTGPMMVLILVIPEIPKIRALIRSSSAQEACLIDWTSVLERALQVWTGLDKLGNERAPGKQKQKQTRHPPHLFLQDPHPLLHHLLGNYPALFLPYPGRNYNLIN